MFVVDLLGQFDRLELGRDWNARQLGELGVPCAQANCPRESECGRDRPDWMRAFCGEISSLARSSEESPSTASAILALILLLGAADPEITLASSTGAAIGPTRLFVVRHPRSTAATMAA